MNSLNGFAAQITLFEGSCFFSPYGESYLVPADAGAVWQHKMRISRTAGERALARVDMLIIN